MAANNGTHGSFQPSFSNWSQGPTWSQIPLPVPLVRPRFDPNFVYLSQGPAFVYLPSQMPTVVWVKLETSRVPQMGGRTSGNEDQVAKLINDGSFPLRPSRLSCSTHVQKISGNRSATIFVHTFPIVSGYSGTVHRVQGQTLNSLVVGEWKGGGTASASAYVTLSRCVTSANVFTLQDFTQEHAQFFLPSVDMLVSELLLMEKEQRTCKSLLQSLCAAGASDFSGYVFICCLIPPTLSSPCFSCSYAQTA